MKKNVLKAVVFAASLAAATYSVTSQSTGLPVIDGANLSQNLITAFENVAQTIKQIQQYKTQLQQYENMLKNTAIPDQYVWDNATKTMNDLRAATDTLQYYKAHLGSIANYLEKFRDTSSYRTSPCFSAAGCSRSEWIKLQQSQVLASEAQKKANDAMLIALDKQQDALISDSAQLQKLQAAAQGASGQMQTLGYANQIASQQANQLLQIRAMLVAQQNMMAARQQALADKEALQSAASAKLRKSTFEKSPIQVW